MKALRAAVARAVVGDELVVAPAPSLLRHGTYSERTVTVALVVGGDGTVKT